MGLSQMNSPQNLATMGTQDENTTQYVLDTTPSLHVIVLKKKIGKEITTPLCVTIFKESARYSERHFASNINYVYIE
jgi:hypothetical protein